ncbi:MAG: hypothetical protein SVU24_03225 [Pseudomonadota bacterium]|jgi:hypothetical protein|nr:hypothetical protein [Pseudomonadota bacterium]
MNDHQILALGLGRYDLDIFTANQTGQDFSRASKRLKNLMDFIGQKAHA